MRRQAPVAIVLAIIGMLLPYSFAGGAEPLGRLFFTPERRAALERQRQYNVQQAETLQGESVSLEGIVKRSSGRSTVWVNGRAQHDHDSAAGVGTVLNSRDPAKAIISNGDEPPVSLRVGESANRATGEKKDVVGSGRIIIKRATAGP